MIIVTTISTINNTLSINAPNIFHCTLCFSIATLFSISCTILVTFVSSGLALSGAALQLLRFSNPFFVRLDLSSVAIIATLSSTKFPSRLDPTLWLNRCCSDVPEFCVVPTWLPKSSGVPRHRIVDNLTNGYKISSSNSICHGDARKEMHCI